MVAPPWLVAGMVRRRLNTVGLEQPDGCQPDALPRVTPGRAADQLEAARTSQPESAECFSTSKKAVCLARERGLQSVEVIWHFDDSEYNLRLPLHEAANRCPDLTPA